MKLSDEDAGWLYPGLETAEVAWRILGLGVKVVALTAGAAGSDLYSESAHLHVPAPQVAAADTVGAGDSYMSSLIAGILTDFGQDFDEEQLRRLGTVPAAAAAITVTRHGANPPTARELREAPAVSS